MHALGTRDSENLSSQKKSFALIVCMPILPHRLHDDEEYYYYSILRYIVPLFFKEKPLVILENVK